MDFNNSNKYLEKAQQVIPLASQTFSKSYLQYPPGVSPLAMDHAKGAFSYDLDNNCYLDMVNSLAAIILGYCDEDVNNAVKQQLEKGTIFSLASPIELEVSEMLVDIVPCAEMVKFGKNASDATAAAIRLSRAVTGKNRVAVCGYHGWQDWYIATTTRSAGVPNTVRELTDTFNYNDIDSLKSLFAKHKGEYAAVIMEPMNAQWPQNNFLSEVKNICKKNGSIFIFDETVTGFRYSLGGAQELFNITPDLCILGKGMANGFPLSAVAGKRELMEGFNDIFFSTTFGGETLSLAAAKATINKLISTGALESMENFGKILMKTLTEICESFGLQEKIQFTGHPVWSFLDLSKFDNLDNMKLKTLYIQTMISNNVICLGTHNISYSFGEKEFDILIRAYKSFFRLLSNVKTNSDLDKLLKVPALKAIMKIR